MVTSPDGWTAEGGDRPGRDAQPRKASWDRFTLGFSDGGSLALFDKLGGQARVRAAAEAEQLGGAELEGLLRRQALAAWYIDRGIAPILAPREDQLREIFRTATHPFRGQSYERVRDALARWFVLERVRAAETGFLQGARSRLRIMPNA